ncbi:G-protein coupled receptor 12-like [Arapaima gigas]
MTLVLRDDVQFSGDQLENLTHCWLDQEDHKHPTATSTPKQLPSTTIYSTISSSPSSLHQPSSCCLPRPGPLRRRPAAALPPPEEHRRTWRKPVLGASGGRKCRTYEDIITPPSEDTFRPRDLRTPSRHPPAGDRSSVWMLGHLEGPPLLLALDRIRSPTMAANESRWLQRADDGGPPPDLSLSSEELQPPPLNPWDVVLCVSGTLISCENAVVVAAIFYTPTLHAPMFLLIGSLATADLLAGLGLVLHFLFRYCVPSDGVQLATAGLLVASFSASVCSLLAITVDRYLSLRHALTYCSARTVTRTHLMLLLTWASALLLGLLPAMGWNCLRDTAGCSVVRPLARAHLALLSGAFLLVFALMLQLYARICRVVCRHAHQIALQRHFLPSSHYVTTRRGISTLALILGAFASCWLPFAVYGLLGDASYPPLYTYATLLPATYNSLLNPLIYAFRNHEIQKVLLAACCGCLAPRLSCHTHPPSDV